MIVQTIIVLSLVIIVVIVAIITANIYFDHVAIKKMDNYKYTKLEPKTEREFNKVPNPNCFTWKEFIEQRKSGK
jgi:hypothetical protein